jgi:predicted metal-dependent hydrolase
MQPEVEVRRSRRRTRTVSAYRQDGRVIMMIPARFSRVEEREWVTTMLNRLERSDRRRHKSDSQLMQRAQELSDEYLLGRAEPKSVRWVSNMTSRWGSCTTTDGTIRLSDRLQQMPAWVLDYVLLHELAHLLEANHNARFWRWVDRYAKAERAKGFLDGVSHAAQLGLTACE